MNATQRMLWTKYVLGVLARSRFVLLCVVCVTRRTVLPLSGDDASVDTDRGRMKIVSLRMSEDTWESIQTEAMHAGISASEFIREAAILRLGYRWAARIDDDEIAVRMRALGIMRSEF